MRSATPFKGQKYNSIKRSCLDRGVLFEDMEFPANNKSLFYSQVDKDITWKRPKEICKAPRLIVEGVSCDDLMQGELGNTWFVTACCCVAQEPKLWQKVIPNFKDQEWDDKNQYAGLFHFHFYRFGSWVDVVIDDRLPTKDGNLVFCHSKTRNEFWSALLEKAYAKLYGDYESLQTGRVADALVDLTGGIAESLLIEEFLEDEGYKRRLFTKLAYAMEGHSLADCYINCAANQVGQDTDDGLLLGSGYVVTRVMKIQVPKSLQGAVGASTLDMIRIHSPWGSQYEWAGAWSPTSKEWAAITATERDKIGLKFHQEGEFWMTYDDFTSRFTDVDICHFVNTSFFSIKKTWSEVIFHGEWKQNGRNGGSQRYEATFLSNPQYVFDITADHEVLLVSLEQHDIRADRQLEIQLLVIGFHIMKVEENRRYRIHIPGEPMMTSDYVRTRSVFQTVRLPRGRFVLIPTTEKPGQNGEFMVRMYTTATSAATFWFHKELTEESPTPSCCGKPHTLVSTLTVVKAEGLKLEASSKGNLDPMVVIRGEGETVKSVVHSNTPDPVWDIKATFYRKKPNVPIIIEIWNHKTLINEFLAEARVEDFGTEDGVQQQLKVFGRKKEAEVEKPGLLFIVVQSSTDLACL